MSAQPAGLNGAETKQVTIVDQIKAYSEENPLATSFYLETERQAKEILLSMAATLKLVSKDVKNPVELAAIVDCANKYRKAVIHDKALELFRSMTDEDRLEMFGLKLEVRRIILQ